MHSSLDQFGLWLRADQKKNPSFGNSHSGISRTNQSRKTTDAVEDPLGTTLMNTTEQVAEKELMVTEPNGWNEQRADGIGRRSSWVMCLR